VLWLGVTLALIGALAVTPKLEESPCNSQDNDRGKKEQKKGKRGEKRQPMQKDLGFGFPSNMAGKKKRDVTIFWRNGDEEPRLQKEWQETFEKSGRREHGPIRRRFTFVFATSPGYPSKSTQLNFICTTPDKKESQKVRVNTQEKERFKSAPN